MISCLSLGIGKAQLRAKLMHTIHPKAGLHLHRLQTATSPELSQLIDVAMHGSCKLQGIAGFFRSRTN